MSESDTEWLHFLQRAVRHEDQATRLLTKIDQDRASASMSARMYAEQQKFLVAICAVMEIQETTTVSPNIKRRLEEHPIADPIHILLWATPPSRTAEQQIKVLALALRRVLDTEEIASSPYPIPIP